MSLSTKDPDEKIVITFDFSSVPQTVSNPVVEITEKGSDVLIPSMLIDIPQVTSNKVMQLIQGGESGKQYVVRCEVDVSATGERFVAKDILPVKL